MFCHSMVSPAFTVVCAGSKLSGMSIILITIVGFAARDLAAAAASKATVITPKMKTVDLNLCTGKTCPSRIINSAPHCCSVQFEKFLNGAHVLGRHIRQSLHMHRDGVPLRRGELRAGSGVMTLVTINRPQMSAFD